MAIFMGHSMESLEDIYVHENTDVLFDGISLVNEDFVKRWFRWCIYTCNFYLEYMLYFIMFLING